MKTGNVDTGVGTNGRVTDDITTDGIGEAVFGPFVRPIASSFGLVRSMQIERACYRIGCSFTFRHLAVLEVF